MSRRIALVGARGYTGSELLGLLAGHPDFELAVASSRSQAGQAIRAVCPSWPNPDSRFVELSPTAVGEYPAEAWVLALPNGHAGEWVEALGASQPEAVILDLSADYRFSDEWAYGLPERFRDRIRGARRIANPGCYATGAQLALLPLLDALDGAPSVFGVSGYSGAGSKPSPRNDPERLRDNLLPYALTGHIHEREVSRQLGREVRLLPHVAAFFRGISLTVDARLVEPAQPQDLLARYRDYYAGEPLVKVAAEIPEIRQVAGTPQAMLGGFAVDGRDPRRVALVATLDNLAKGAASQALQNLNLALGLDEFTGLTV